MALPAHLLLAPLDKGGVVSFSNYDDVSLNPLQESTAFRKLAKVSKVPQNLLQAWGSETKAQSTQPDNLSGGGDTFLLAGNFSTKRQTNYLTPTSLTNNHSLGLDKASFIRFLSTSSQEIQDTSALNHPQVTQVSPQTSFYDTFGMGAIAREVGFGRIFAQTNPCTITHPSLPYWRTLGEVFSGDYIGRTVDRHLNFEGLGQEMRFGGTVPFIGAPYTLRSLASTNYSFLTAEQNPRQYRTPSTNFPSLNLESEILAPNLYAHFGDSGAQVVMAPALYPLALNLLSYEPPFTPIFSTNPLINTSNLDHSNKPLLGQLNYQAQEHLYPDYRESTDIFTLRGKRDGAPAFLTTTYWKLF